MSSQTRPKDMLVQILGQNRRRRVRLGFGATYPIHLESPCLGRHCNILRVATKSNKFKTYFDLFIISIAEKVKIWSCKRKTPTVWRPFKERIKSANDRLSYVMLNRCSTNQITLVSNQNVKYNLLKIQIDRITIYIKILLCQWMKRMMAMMRYNDLV